MRCNSQGDHPTNPDPSSYLNERVYAGHVLGMCLYSAGVALSIIWSLIAG